MVIFDIKRWETTRKHKDKDFITWATSAKRIFADFQAEQLTYRRLRGRTYEALTFLAGDQEGLLQSTW